MLERLAAELQIGAADPVKAERPDGEEFGILNVAAFRLEGSPPWSPGHPGAAGPAWPLASAARTRARTGGASNQQQSVEHVMQTGHAGRVVGDVMPVGFHRLSRADNDFAIGVALGNECRNNSTLRAPSELIPRSGTSRRGVFVTIQHQGGQFQALLPGVLPTGAKHLVGLDGPGGPSRNPCWRTCRRWSSSLESTRRWRRGRASRALHTTAGPPGKSGTARPVRQSRPALIIGK